MAILLSAVPIGAYNSVHENVVSASTEQVYTKSDVEVLIHKYSESYGVPYNKIYNIIACETANTFDPKVQSFVKYNFNDPARQIVAGGQERSFGLAQIHLPDHPEITYEQATNAEFSVRFIAETLSKGKYIWYCKI